MSTFREGVINGFWGKLWRQVGNGDLVEQVVIVNTSGRPVPLGSGWPQSLGFTRLTALATATGLGSIPAGAKRALIVNEGPDPVRFRDDGVDPSSTVGNSILPFGSVSYEGTLSALRLIQTRADAANALSVTFFAE